MKLFTILCAQIEFADNNEEIITALTNYFSKVDKEEIFIAYELLSGNTPQRIVYYPDLIRWVKEITTVPDWLFEASNEVVKDRIETITLLLPNAQLSEMLVLKEVYDEILFLQKTKSVATKQFVQNIWNQTDAASRYIFNRLITNTFRLNVPKYILHQALSIFTGVEAPIISIRLSEKYDHEIFWQRILTPTLKDQNTPVALAEKKVVSNLQGINYNISACHITMQYQSIRVQVIISDEVYIWDYKSALITKQFPELKSLNTSLPKQTVFIAQLVMLNNKQPDMGALELRLNKKNITKALVNKSPVVLIIEDVIKFNGDNVSKMPFKEKVVIAAKIANISGGRILIEEALMLSDWEAFIALSHNLYLYNRVGLLVQPDLSIFDNEDSFYFKPEPKLAKAVLLYAERIILNGESLFLHYTLGIKDNIGLVPFAKVNAQDLDAPLIKELHTWIKENVREKFGPVTSVPALHVFEIAFDGIARTKRRKSGIMAVNPRMKKYCGESPLDDLDSIGTLSKWVAPEL
jgi:DNA ligase 1